MQENVGRVDQVFRGILGATFITLGYTVFGAKRGRIGGLISLMAGTFVLETAFTRVSLFNRLFRMDTRKLDRKVLPEKWQQRGQHMQGEQQISGQGSYEQSYAGR